MTVPVPFGTVRRAARSGYLAGHGETCSATCALAKRLTLDEDYLPVRSRCLHPGQQQGRR